MNPFRYHFVFQSIFQRTGLPKYPCLHPPRNTASIGSQCLYSLLPLLLSLELTAQRYCLFLRTPKKGLDAYNKTQIFISFSAIYVVYTQRAGNAHRIPSSPYLLASLLHWQSQFFTLNSSLPSGNHSSFFIPHFKIIDFL